MALGTAGIHSGTTTGEMFDYVSIKHALLSGGINHIDTGS